MKKLFNKPKVKSKKAKSFNIRQLSFVGLVVLFTVHCSLITVRAQTTDFSYQGILKSSGAPANGNFDFEFRLFDAAGGGTQQGPTNNVNNVAVVNGVYSVTLNFGAVVFGGGDRFLDISVRVAGVGTVTQLTPRQRINSTPYAIRSLSAANANNALNAANFTGSLEGEVTGTQSATAIAANAVTNTKIANGAVTDPKIAAGQVVKSINTLKDNVTLAAGSNITITPSGNTLTIASTGGGGGGGILNQTTLQAGANFNISGNGTVGGTLTGAIVSATTQFNFGVNRFLGQDFNSVFLGFGAGAANTSGTQNTFLGQNTGAANTTSARNTFVGSFAGQANTSGTSNVFVGSNAGLVSTGGVSNVFIGDSAGVANTSGGANAFVGILAGGANTIGGSNTFLGASAGGGTLDGNNNTFVGHRAGITNTVGGSNTVVGKDADVGSNNLSFATAVGSGAIVETNNRVQLGRDGLDTVRIGTLGAATAANLCIRPENILASCSSSGRYKENIEPLGRGLNLVRQLHPVTFDWKDRDERDLGLIAEEVEKIDPILVTYNRNGEIQGVKYDQLSVVLINAVKEQQAEISGQQSVISDQQRQIDELNSMLKFQKAHIEALKKLLCSQNPTAEICRLKD